jgi:hypothetical protein
VPSHQVGLLFKIFGKSREKLNEKFDVYYPINFTLYTPTHIEEDEFDIPNIEYENQSYSIKLSSSGVLEIGEDIEAINFLGSYFKSPQVKLKYKPIGKKYFDSSSPMDYPN